MLPGFRFLFAAIVLSMSVLVFGFGAAALLRTAHEEFASTPSWQPAPETRFAQNHPAAPPAAQPASPPVLAMLRVDDPPKETPQDSKADQPASDAAPATGPVDRRRDHRNRASIRAGKDRRAAGGGFITPRDG